VTSSHVAKKSRSAQACDPKTGIDMIAREQNVELHATTPLPNKYMRIQEGVDYE
jgi:hypothetical protein